MENMDDDRFVPGVDGDEYVVSPARAARHGKTLVRAMLDGHPSTPTPDDVDDPYYKLFLPSH